MALHSDQEHEITEACRCRLTASASLYYYSPRYSFHGARMCRTSAVEYVLPILPIYWARSLLPGAIHGLDSSSTSLELLLPAVR